MRYFLFIVLLITGSHTEVQAHYVVDISTATAADWCLTNDCLEFLPPQLVQDLKSPQGAQLRVFLEELPEEKRASVVKLWTKLSNAPASIRQNIDLLDDAAQWPKSWQIIDGNVSGTIDVLDGAGTSMARIFPDRIVASGRVAKGQAGNKVLNRVPLIKNYTYEVDGIDYFTDELGRVSKAAGDLDDMVRIRLGNQQIRAVDVKDGVRGSDQGGHIIAARFFGVGEQINYYPQSANLNQGAWRMMEDRWAKEMVNGKDVKVEINAVFGDGLGRPDGFEVNYWIGNVKATEVFDN